MQLVVEPEIRANRQRSNDPDQLVDYASAYLLIDLLRDAVIEKTLGSLVWSAIAGLGVLFLDYLKNRGLNL